MDTGFLEYALSFLSDNRRKLFLDIVEKRTRHFTVVLEDLYQSHNASAVMRTCDCFGIQDIHIIENRNKWSPSPDVERGSSKWISLYKYNSEENNSLACIKTLKEEGYRIVATSPRGKITPEELDIHKPIAFVFGTEMDGVTDTILNQADDVLRIPMYGFTESFNISVSAAVLLSSVRQKAESLQIDLQIPREEQNLILLDWCEKMLKNFPQYHKAWIQKTEG
jgi:tRNA (guanosine-2'-O-)-methyltransferase